MAIGLTVLFLSDLGVNSVSDSESCPDGILHDEYSAYYKHQVI